MRRILTLLLVAVFAINAHAALTPVKPVLKASDVLVPIGKSGQRISLYDLAYISASDFEKASGQQLKFTEKAGFKLAQRELRKSIAPDGSIESKRMRKALTRIQGGEYGFHFGGFALGFFLGLVGILIAYLINDDYKRNRVKWAWLGLAIYLALVLVFVASLA